MQNINFGCGKVTYNDFDIELNIPIENQLYSLKEDLIQVDYDERYIIDIGWYPEFSLDGSFRIVAIENYDWGSPLFTYSCKTLEQLHSAIEESVDRVEKLLR